MCANGSIIVTRGDLPFQSDFMDPLAHIMRCWRGEAT